MNKIISLRILLLTLSLVCSRALVIAQFETKLIADSVRIKSNNGTGEFILENSTKNIPGYLYNKGNGRTEFKIPAFVDSLIRKGDSVIGYSIGFRSTGFYLPTTTVDNIWSPDGNNFSSEKWLGTSTNFSLPFRTNNVERGRIAANGDWTIGINGTTYFPNAINIKPPDSLIKSIMTSGSNNEKFLQLTQDGGNMSFGQYAFNTLGTDYGTNPSNFENTWGAVAIGSEAAPAAKRVQGSVIIGNGSAYYTTSLDQDVIIGAWNLPSGTSSGSTIIGANAFGGFGASAHSYANTGVGIQAGSRFEGGELNTIIGAHNCGEWFAWGGLTGSANTTVGSYVMAFGTGSVLNYNSLMGYEINHDLGNNLKFEKGIGLGSNITYGDNTMTANATQSLTNMLAIGHNISNRAGSNTAMWGNAAQSHFFGYDAVLKSDITAGIKFKFNGGAYFGGKLTIGSANPATSSVFNVSSTTQGSIPAPIMTTAQRDAIASPTAGLQVYNSTTNKPNFYNGTSWKEIGLTSGTATLISGTITVNTSAVKANSKIFVSVNTPSGTQGFLSAPSASIVAGTSFVINSTSNTENSTINWVILE